MQTRVLAFVYSNTKSRYSNEQPFSPDNISQLLTSQHHPVHAEKAQEGWESENIAQFCT